MKKLKLGVSGILLSAFLAGNVFAGDFARFGLFSFFDDVAKAVETALRSADPCEGRICTNCKPGTGGDESGTCRPPEN